MSKQDDYKAAKKALDQFNDKNPSYDETNPDYQRLNQAVNTAADKLPWWKR